MKLFDINVSAGHWPFRKLALEKPGEIKAHLEDRGVAGAAICNTHGVFYRNCRDADLELAAWLEGEKDFFAGVATVNPFFPRWESDLEKAARELAFRGARLLPRYHGYALDSVPAEMASLAGALDLPVFIPHRLADPRGRHLLDAGESVGLEEAARFCARFPGLKVILTEAAVSADSLAAAKPPPNLFFEISRVRSACGRDLARIAGVIGPERLLFGSGCPFRDVAPAILKLVHSGLGGKEKAAIGRGNARRLLGLDREKEKDDE